MPALEMADCFVASPLTMASLATPLSSTQMPSSASAAGGDTLTPLSSLAIGGGAAPMATDGSRAEYVPPDSLPSNTALSMARAVEAEPDPEPDDDGVRTLQRLE